MATAGTLANAGEVVVGGQKATEHGHVIVVYPGPAKPRGGYVATKSDGEQFTVARKGLYPLAMSTSNGDWPGAMSKGDKTVWDPWGKDPFKVKFWHHDIGKAKSTTATAIKSRDVLNQHNKESVGSDILTKLLHFL